MREMISLEIQKWLETRETSSENAFHKEDRWEYLTQSFYLQEANKNNNKNKQTNKQGGNLNWKVNGREKMWDMRTERKKILQV